MARIRAHLREKDDSEKIEKQKETNEAAHEKQDSFQ